MKRFSEQLNKKAASIRMNVSEKSELKSRLVSYMEYHPLPTDMKTKKGTIASEAFTTFSPDWVHIRNFAGMFAVLLLVIVPTIAEKSIPGDVLYPVKVSFNEEIRSSLTLSPYQKIEWETERLGRRVAEAHLLASKGELTAEVEAGVAEAVKEHSEAAQKQIESIREDDSDGAALADIAFTSALEVQSEILEKYLDDESTASTSEDGHSITVLAGAVGVAHDNAVAAKGNETPSHEKLTAQIEIETTRAYELFGSVSEYASKEERSDIERRLKDVGRKVSDAAQEGNNSELESESLLVTALADTQKLISFMTNIDVRANVTVEELVPIVLTDEELVVGIKRDIEEAAMTKARVEARIPAVPAEVLEKVTVGLDRLTILLENVYIALDSGNIDAAERVRVEASAIAEDLDQLTETYRGAEKIEAPAVESETPDVLEAESADEPEILNEEGLEETVIEESETSVDSEESQEPEEDQLLEGEVSADEV